ncbi:MAG: phosphoenolpyruvate carboxylase [Ignavibacteriales bacterium]|nr:MAG: phosphoenolpyruvate carboxylase [Ignavibacteriales bacterium]
MNSNSQVEVFEKEVQKQFILYNSLFLNLSLPEITSIGTLIPVLQETCTKGLKAGKRPEEIIDKFFKTYTIADTEEKKIGYLLKVIQYIERQIVLFDSIEDAAFGQIKLVEGEPSVEDYLQMSKGKPEQNKIEEKLKSYNIRLVFTAHPTQFYSDPVLDIINRLRKSIIKQSVNKVDTLLKQLSLTSLINRKKPTPEEEAMSLIYFLRNIYYDGVGELVNSLKKIFPSDSENTKLIELGLWAGGDRDGNPFVTSQTTIQVADHLRVALMKCYYNDIKKLEKKITFKKTSVLIADLKLALYESMFNDNRILTYGEIIQPLLQIKDIVLKDYNSLYLDDIDRLIDKVKVFKTHFASIDIRQNHLVQKQIIENILRSKKLIKKSIDEVDDRQLQKWLLSAQSVKLNAVQFEDSIHSEMIKSIQRINLIQTRNGEYGCHRYIISNSEDMYSVLFVFALLRWNNNGNKVKMDIVPLFETMEGMENSGSIMRSLFSIPEYRRHIKERGNVQTVMLGYSDGTKDGGYLKANWMIFKTKEEISEVCNEHGIKVIFFDGRGGPPSRGGGKTHRFYASSSDRISDTGIHLTIQGQTISSKFGTKKHFKHQCEQLIAAGIRNSYEQENRKIPDEMRSLLDRLSDISYKKYFSLINHEKFIPYLERKSTLPYYGETRIGSRPVKRSKNSKLNLSDLRAIPFVGAWSQLKQNVPGFFGIGTALESLVKEGKTAQLKKLFKDVKFFKALILNSMMSLTKTNFSLTAYYKHDKEFGGFWKILYDEYELTKKMILLISNSENLMEEEPASKKSIEMREKIVIPLLVIQQYALEKNSSNEGADGHYKTVVRRSLYGNINASRNSA